MKTVSSIQWGGFVAVLMTLCVVGCGGGGTTVVDNSAAASSDGSWHWDLPKNFPQPQVPADNPMSEAKFQLGRRLFYDTRLSGNGTKACASCHFQNLAFTDGKAFSTGSTGQQTTRSAMGIANSVYHPTLTWGNPTLTSLEKQMEVPLLASEPVEMGINEGNRELVLQRFRDDSDYVARFKAVFPADAQPINLQNVIKAIATFQRGILSGNSRFDRYQRGEATLTTDELRGLNLFNSEKAECFHCHSGFNFNDQVVYTGARVVETPFHNTGLYNLGGNGDYPAPNRGVYEVSHKLSDMGAFRAQSLRNVALTAPYMHDGSIATLEEVLDFYAAGGRNITSGIYAGDGRANPYKSELIALIDLNAQEKADIVAFLKTLSDDGLLSNPRFANPFNTTP
ncbi:MAG TPA: di-heme enzyme [bacterium]|nr:di-heme enzyme [bacterium]